MSEGHPGLTVIWFFIAWAFSSMALAVFTPLTFGISVLVGAVLSLILVGAGSVVLNINR